MQLSKKTLDVLKNLATINPSILVSEGNELVTIAIAKNIIAEATVAETFETRFAIYDLNEFLSAISLFTAPDLIFGEKFVTIRETGVSRGGLKYFYANESLIVSPNKKIADVKFEIDAEFVIDDSTISKVQKAGSVLGVGDVAVVGDEEGISLIVMDKNNNSSNDFEVQVSETPVSDFKYFFKLENLKIMPGKYSVSITSKGLSKFISDDGIQKYAIALEK